MILDPAGFGNLPGLKFFIRIDNFKGKLSILSVYLLAHINRPYRVIPDSHKIIFYNLKINNYIYCHQFRRKINMGLEIYLDLQLKPAPIQPKKQLLITDEVIKWGDKTINTKDVTEVKYGSVIMGTMGIQTNQNYSFKFRGNNDQVLAIYFSSVSIAAPNEKLEDAFKNIENAVWNAVTSRIVQKWIDDLQSGKQVITGDITLSREGIKIKVSKLFSSRDAFINWADADKNLYNGYLEIGSVKNKKDKCSLSIQNDWNAITLQYFLNWLWKENRRI